MPDPELWDKYSRELGELRKQLRDVPVTDRATWAHVARETSGAFAAWSQRAEATAGPLAATSRELVRRGPRDRPTGIRPRRGYRARNPERPAAAMRRWQQEDRERLTAYQRDYRAQNRDVYERTLASNREARRRDRRLKALGLPAKQIRPPKVPERIRNDQAATAFFTRLRGPEARRQILAQYEPTPPELIAEWQRRSRLGKVRASATEGFPQRLDEYHAKHGDRLREEVRMDSTARALRGASPLNVDDEVNRRASEAVWRATAGLGRRSQEPSARSRNHLVADETHPAPGETSAAITELSLSTINAMKSAKSHGPTPSGSKKEPINPSAAVKSRVVVWRGVLSKCGRLTHVILSTGALLP